MTSSAYVFVDGLESMPVICGIFQLNVENKTGEFRYGQSFLARDDAFPLDPIHLPLSDKIYKTRFQRGIFGVLADAGADSWGKKLILSLHTTKPKNDVEFLLAGAGMGVGALTFSLSRNASKSKVNKNSLGDIGLLLQGKDAIFNDERISPEAKKAFEFGSSMGGARPKTLINDHDKTYLAKFNRPDDLFNVVNVEHAAMRMLAELDARVANTQVQKTPNGDVLLVERFDRKIQQPSHHFISANALLSKQKVSQISLTNDYSYGYLAEFILKKGCDPLDAHALYLRMVFNVLIGNTDDHVRNHAFLYSFQERTWRLSPAYDVLPINNSQQHALGIGNAGRQGTIENLLSQSMRFGLKPFKAKKIIQQAQDLVAEWPSYFVNKGVSGQDIERLKGVIPNVK